MAEGRDGRCPDPPAAVIFGCSGPVLTAAEREFFRAVRPFGFILFARNVDTVAQVRVLTDNLRACVGRPDAPVLMDQEGGRVQRLRPPLAPDAPPMRHFGDLHRRDPAAAASALRSALVAQARALRACGVTVNCAPVLDVPGPDGHPVIGDRAFADDPETVAVLGAVAVDALLRGGVTPVVKHLPGHGRANADSHEALPVVAAARADLARTDFLPFRRLAHGPTAAAIWGMTAHVVFSALDPARPATLSPTVIRDVIRGDIGFGGLLLSDDLGMDALDGDFASRARRALAAGCDVVLHCSGVMKEMEAVATAVPLMSPVAMRAGHGRRPTIASIHPLQNHDRRLT